jgi:hypothetical protein
MKTLTARVNPRGDRDSGIARDQRRFSGYLKQRLKATTCSV